MEPTAARSHSAPAPAVAAGKAAPGPLHRPWTLPSRVGAPDWRRARSAAARFLREAAVAGALVTGATVPFLVSPHPGPDAEARYCLRPMTLAGPVHVNVLCDSGGFLLLAEDPGRVLTELTVWQSRPLYGAVGWVLAQPFRALGFGELGLRLMGDARDPGREVLYGSYLPYFAGFILLNGLLLVATLMLFRRLVGAGSYRDPRILLPIAVLLVNHVTKLTFWSPHLQMLNILIPVASLSLFCWMQPRLGELTWGRAAEIGAALGVASLAYGAFAVPAAGAALLLLAGPGAMLRRAARAAVLLGAFALPTVAWTAYVVARTGSFFSHEMDRYRQFVWLADAAAEGPGALASRLAHNLGEYAHVLGTVAAFPALVVAALVLAAHLLGVRRGAGEPGSRAARAVLVYLVVSIPFYALMGFYRTRLAWTVVPALLLLMALETGELQAALRPRARRLLAACAAVLAVGYSAFWWMRAGPFADMTPTQEQAAEAAGAAQAPSAVATRPVDEGPRGVAVRDPGAARGAGGGRSLALH